MPHIQIANPNKTHTGHHLMPWGYMEPKSEPLLSQNYIKLSFVEALKALEFKGGEIMKNE